MTIYFKISRRPLALSRLWTGAVRVQTVAELIHKQGLWLDYNICSAKLKSPLEELMT